MRHMVENVASSTRQLSPVMRRVIALTAQAYAQSYNNLGNAFHQKAENSDQAIAAFRRAIDLNADFFEAHNNLANALVARKDCDEAIVFYHRAIALRPTSGESHYNLGVALSHMGRFDAAIAAFRSAIASNLDRCEVHNNHRECIKKPHCGELDDAVAAYQRAIALKPTCDECHNNLGSTFKDMGQLDDAIAAYRRAITLRPDFAEAHGKPGLPYAPLSICIGYDTRAIADRRKGEWHAHQHAEPVAAQVHSAPHVNDRSPGRRLRIGYVSGDFRQHVIGQNLLPLLANHDHGFNSRSLVMPTCFIPMHSTDRFGQLADRWRDVVRVNPMSGWPSWCGGT